MRAPNTLPSALTPVKASAPPKAFTPLVIQFLDYLHLEKHFSDYTVKSYGADLIQFGQFLAGEIGPAAAAIPAGVTAAKVLPTEIDARITKCEPLAVREFLAYLYGHNYTKSTTARKLATLRSFYKFLIRRGIVSASPLITIRTPKQEKRLPKCLDLEQVQKLLEAPGDADLLAARDKAMLEVLYSSGIRVSELVELEHGRHRSSGRRASRSRQRPQGPPHAHRQPGHQGRAAILSSSARRSPSATAPTRPAFS